MKTLKDFRCQSEQCCDRDNCNNQKINVESLREEAIKWVKENKEINTADWVQFFNIEGAFADAILGATE